MVHMTINTGGGESFTVVYTAMKAMKEMTAMKANKEIKANNTMKANHVTITDKGQMVRGRRAA